MLLYNLYILYLFVLFRLWREKYHNNQTTSITPELQKYSFKR